MLACARVCIYANMYVCMYVYMHACIYVCAKRRNNWCSFISSRIEGLLDACMHTYTLCIPVEFSREVEF
jgi:hypothetical protein